MTIAAMALLPMLWLAAARAGAACPGTPGSADPGWSAWAGVLEAHTAEVPGLAGVAVDYRGLRDAPAWDRVLRGLADCDPETLGSRAERLAFWINAYNILAIEIVLDHYPVEGIRDIGSFFRPVWKREAGRVGGEGHSLDRIEHDILRPMGEPRIHAAIVCASLSCPPLRREPYRAAELDAQLDDHTRRFLADPRKGARWVEDEGTLYLSRIFDWFSGDFEAAGGVLPFVRRHLPEDVRRQVPDDPRIRYLDYDWSLNALERSR